MSGFKLLCFISSIAIVMAVPIVLKGSSPSGETVIAISSSDPNFEKYLSFNFPDKIETSEDFNGNPTDLFHKTLSTTLAGTHTSAGRVFPSFNPFFLPFFNLPFNFDGLVLNFSPWMRSIENHEPLGNGEVKTVTSINDNGHVYGKVKTIHFNNKKSQS